jgi:S1-C subfamily serine protease
MDTSLIRLSDDVAAVVKGVEPSVVAIYAGGRMSSSGVHWSAGAIVTAEHALPRDEEIRLGLPDGTIVPAELVGRDPGTDLAVLKFDAASMPVIPRSAGAIHPGNIVLAIGRHRDIGVCAAMGILSVAGDASNTWRGGRLDRFLRLDISLYSGTAGAAVVNAAGEAIGIATSVFSRIAPVAIPQSTVDRISGDLLKRGYVARAYLGVGLQSVPMPADLAPGGLLVVSIEPNSPAEKAGLVFADVLISLNGRPVKDTRGVQAFLIAENIGKTVSLTAVRGGKRIELPVTVGEKSQ